MAEATQVHTNGKSHINKADLKNEIQDGVREIGNRAGKKGEELVQQAENLSDRLPEMVKTAQEKVANTVEQVATVATDKAGQAAQWLKDRSEGAFEKSDVALSSTREFVRKYPVRTLAAGLAVGALVGWIFSSRGRSEA